MACRFTELAVDAKDHRELARFWAEVLGWEIGGKRDDFTWLKPPSPATPAIVFAAVPEGKTVKNRVHIDVNPTDRTRDEEVERLIALGATHADVGQRDVSWVVLADPEGNEFCVLRSQVDADPAKPPWPDAE